MSNRLPPRSSSSSRIQKRRQFAQDKHRGGNGRKGFKLGEKVLTCYRGNPENKKYPGVIAKVAKIRDGIQHYDIAYDDGDEDFNISERLIFKQQDMNKYSEKEDLSNSEASEIENIPVNGKNHNMSKNQKYNQEDDKDSNSDDTTEAKNLYKGDKVLCHYHGKMTQKAYPGVVARINKDGTYDINYDDGDQDKRISREAIILQKKRKAKNERRNVSKRGQHDSDGEDGFSNYDNNDDDNDDDDYDNDDDDIYEKGHGAYKTITAKLQQRKHRVTKLMVGMSVHARYKGEGKFYAGVIARVRKNGTFDIDYADGDKEKEVERHNIRSDKGEIALSGSLLDDLKNHFLDIDSNERGYVSKVKFSEGLNKVLLLKDSRIVHELVQLHPGKTKDSVNYVEFLQAISKKWKAISEDLGKNSCNSFQAQEHQSSSEREDDENEEYNGEVQVIRPHILSKIQTCFENAIKTNFEEDKKQFDLRPEKAESDKDFFAFLKKSIGKKQILNSDIHDLICCFDVDGDGLVERREFFRYALFSKCNINPKLLHLLNKLREKSTETSISGRMSQQFKKAQKFVQKHKSSVAVKILSLLKSKDRNETGFVSLNSFQSSLQTLRLGLEEDEINDLLESLKAMNKDKERLSFSRKKAKLKAAKIYYPTFVELLKYPYNDIDKVKRRFESILLLAKQKGISITGSTAFTKQDEFDSFQLTKILNENLGMPITSEDVSTLISTLSNGTEKDETITGKDITNWLRKCMSRYQGKRSIKKGIDHLKEKAFSSNLKLTKCIEGFKQFDKDSKGSITRHDFLQVISKKGFRINELSKIRPVLESLDPERKNAVKYKTIKKFIRDSVSSDEDSDESDQEGSNSESEEEKSSQRNSGYDDTDDNFSEDERDYRKLIVLSKSRRKLIRERSLRFTSQGGNFFSTRKVMEKALSHCDSFNKRKNVIDMLDFTDFLRTNLKLKSNQEICRLFKSGKNHVDCLRFTAYVDTLTSFSSKTKLIQFAEKARQSYQKNLQGIFDIYNISLSKRLLDYFKENAPKLASEEKVRKEMKRFKGKLKTLDEIEFLNQLSRIHRTKQYISLKSSFLRSDKNHTGYVSSEAFTKIMGNCCTSLSKEELNRAAQYLSKQGSKSGYILYESFSDYVEPNVLESEVLKRLNTFIKSNSNKEEDFKFLLSKVDKKHKDWIHASEFTKVILEDIGLPFSSGEMSVLARRCDRVRVNLFF